MRLLDRFLCLNNTCGEKVSVRKLFAQTCQCINLCVRTTKRPELGRLQRCWLCRELVLLCPTMFTLRAAQEMWPIHKFSSLCVRGSVHPPPHPSPSLLSPLVFIHKKALQYYRSPLSDAPSSKWMLQTPPSLPVSVQTKVEFKKLDTPPPLSLFLSTSLSLHTHIECSKMWTNPAISELCGMIV